MRRRLDGEELTFADDRGRRASFRLVEWEPKEVRESPYPSGHGDAVITGTVERVVLPDTYTVVHYGDRQYEITSRSAPVVGVETPACFRVDTIVGVEIHVVRAPELIRVSTSGEHVVIDFSDGNRGAVRLAHEDTDSGAPPVITVPRTAEGVATALSAVHRTTGEFSPDRTLPATRSQPAKLSFARSESIPESLRCGGSDVELTVPPSLDMLAGVSPLVQYLGADVCVEDEDRITVDTGDGLYELARDTVGKTAGETLRAVFGLDCLARCGGPNEPRELIQSDVLERAGLTAGELYDQSMASRVDAYLSRLQNDQIPVDEFPDWHFWLSVEPSFDRFPAVVASLRRLPAVRVAEGPHDSWSRTDRGVLSDSDYTDLDVNLVDPPHEPRRTHAWLADGIPAGGTKLLPSAVTGDQTPIVSPDVVVVDNLEMGAEADTVVPFYRRLTEIEGGSCRIRRDLSRTELRAVIESEADHLHLVGHCNAEGIRCGEEHLSVEDIDRVGLSSFVLNACDSIELGRILIENGATAGVTTTRKIITAPARSAGEECVRFLVNGWPVTRAIERAERAVNDSDTGYVTVGDGTYAITGTDSVLPPSVEITSPTGSQDLYTVSTTFDHPIEPGVSVSLPDPFDDRRWLPGDGRTHRLTRSELRSVLNELESAVVFDGSLQWPEEVDL